MLSSLGAMFVWFAWFGLAPGNGWLMTSSFAVGSKVAVSTALAACASGLSALGLSRVRRNHLELQVGGLLAAGRGLAALLAALLAAWLI